MKRKVFVITEKGRILSGINVYHRKGERPDVRIREELNIGDSQATTLPLDELTKLTLRERVLDEPSGVH